MLIDTGFYLDVCWTAIDQALKELGSNMTDTDLLITHAHSDHFGLMQCLSTPDNTVWIGKTDAKMLENLFANLQGRSANHLHDSGLLDMGVPNTPEEEAITKYAGKGMVDLTLLNDGDLLEVGDYRFKCVETPGHTPGHMCLYEQDQKILISGDHILDKITPNIGLWEVSRDALGEYLTSLDKTAALDVEIVLPGHRTLIHDMYRRIEELKQHHRQRLQNVLDIVGAEGITAGQTAAKMKWDLSYRQWDDFPFNQKMHAAGEAMSHLYHLHMQGELNMVRENGVYYFSKT